MAEETPRHSESAPGPADRAPEERRERRDEARGARGRHHRSKDKRQQGSLLRELPIILGAALVLSLLIKTFLVQAFYIPSGSMENTLLVGDRVFVNKLAVRFGEIERGDIVVFHDPADWLPDPVEPPGSPVATGVRDALEFIGLAPSSSGDDLIKRVIGVGGDTVACCDPDGRLTVNGEPLEEPYLFAGNVPSDIEFEVAVPDGSLWVMGDHRSVSEDSRVHLGEPGGGFVPVEDVIGRAFVVVWPFDRFQGLTRPDTFDQLAAAAR